MTIYRPYDRWGAGTTAWAAATSSPTSRQCPPHLTSIKKPTERWNESNKAEKRVFREFHLTAATQQVRTQTTTSLAVQNPSPAPCTCRTAHNDGKRLNKGNMAELRAWRKYYLAAPMRHVHPPITGATTARNTCPTPCTIRMMQNDRKQCNKSMEANLRILREYCSNTQMRRVEPQVAVTTSAPHPIPAACILGTVKNSGTYHTGIVTSSGKHTSDKTFKDTLLDMIEELKRLQQDVKELRADMASKPRSVAITSTPQLPTSPVVLSPSSLTWVPSLFPAPIPAHTPLVLPPIHVPPAVPPGLQKPTPLLPTTTETIPTPPKPKPDLGLVVHTTVHVSPEKAPPPHPLSPSTTGVVLFSLLLLHYRGSYHWLVIFQTAFLEPSGIRPDPEPPPFCRGNGTGFILQLFII